MAAAVHAPGGAIIPPLYAIVGQNGQLEIDVGILAKKALASFALAITNSCLTAIVGVQKLTGFTLISSPLIGWLTKPLHRANMALATHAFAPFHKWSEILQQENTRILETDRMVEIKDGKFLFYPGNYGKQALDSFQLLMAPVSIALIVTNAVLWIAIKPLWLTILGGILAEILITLLFLLNVGVGYLTYSDLKQCSKEMFDYHRKWLDKVLPEHGF